MTKLDYFIARCEAAEKYAYYHIDYDEGNHKTTLQGLRELYSEWHLLVNTPEPEDECEHDRHYSNVDGFAYCSKCGKYMQ